MVSASAAKTKDGVIVVSLANVSLDKAQEVEFAIDGMTAKAINGEVLASKNITDYNDFAHPETVKPAVFKEASIKKNIVKVKIPAASIVVLNIK